MAPVCDFKKVSYLAQILQQANGYRCHFFFVHLIKRGDSMLPWFCSEIDHRRHQNMVNITDTLACESMPLFLFVFVFCLLFLPHFDVIFDLLLNKRTATSAVARPSGQPRQAGVARGVRGHAPPPPRNFEL